MKTKEKKQSCLSKKELVKTMGGVAPGPDGRGCTEQTLPLFPWQKTKFPPPTNSGKTIF